MGSNYMNLLFVYSSIGTQFVPGALKRVPNAACRDNNSPHSYPAGSPYSCRYSTAGMNLPFSYFLTELKMNRKNNGG